MNQLKKNWKSWLALSLLLGGEIAGIPMLVTFISLLLWALMAVGIASAIGSIVLTWTLRNEGIRPDQIHSIEGFNVTWKEWVSCGVWVIVLLYCQQPALAAALITCIVLFHYLDQQLKQASQDISA